MSKPYPQRVPDTIPVRRTRDLPPPSFGFRVATDTLGLGYTLPATWRVRDFHPLDCARAGRTAKKGAAIIGYSLSTPIPVKLYIPRFRVGGFSALYDSQVFFKEGFQFINDVLLLFGSAPPPKRDTGGVILSMSVPVVLILHLGMRYRGICGYPLF